MSVHVTVWDETGGGGEPVVLVHGSTSWGDDPVFGFAAQRPLARRFRLVAMDRRGYGDSPDSSTGFAGDYEVDTEDVLALMGEGAHLVAHSYGAVGVMWAAARRPEAVLSMTLVEPGCYQAAADDPVVAKALAANRAAYAALPEDVPADVSLRAATESVGLPPLEPTPRRLRAARSAFRERVCWEAAIPVAELAAAPWPKLVISGTWENVPALYRERGGEPLMACARVTAERIGARRLQIPGTAHWPHTENPEAVNAALEELWTNAVTRNA
ncbi:alpha/beta fold hydrolase [Actinomadura kijaniata]|uniref:alpha/beta fold hydrolase n=1 Tax=Actinomadura kijaniata TaxID=46161 RepID=UPI000A7E3B0A|nr:alpha/beta hydrolase [Actinomadura kijaniata]